MQALTLTDELGMRPLQAHCHLGLRPLFVTIGRHGEARAGLSTAIKLYRAMEMTFWLPQTEAEPAQVAYLQAPEPVDRTPHATAVMCLQYDTGAWTPAAIFHCAAD